MSAAQRDAAKRAQAVHLRALLRYALTKNALLSLRDADAAVAQLFTDPTFVALNREFHESAFRIYINE